jgi:hypothetical protein
VLSGKATNTNCIVFGLTRPRLEHYRVEYDNHFTTDAVLNLIVLCNQLLFTKKKPKQWNICLSDSRYNCDTGISYLFQFSIAIPFCCIYIVFTKLYMDLVVLVKKISVLIQFILPNTNLVSVLSKICLNFAGHVWRISWTCICNLCMFLAMKIPIILSPKKWDLKEFFFPLRYQPKQINLQLTSLK